MKMKKALLIVLTMTVLASCQEEVEYPVEPHITYEGFDYVVDGNNNLTGEGVLHIGYTDGDGDLGLDDGDTLYPFGINDPHYYNLLIDYITPSDTFKFDARFKRLVFNDEVKAISGTIDYTMMLLNPLAPHDSIRLKIHIIDRALHESNTIETEPICFLEVRRQK